MKLLYLLPMLVLGWAPAAAGAEAPAPDYSEYVYLHVTRNDVAPREMSCRGRVQPIRG